MNEVITEKNYPVQGLWVFKSISSSLFTLIFFVPYLLISSRLGETNKGTEISLIILIVGFAVFRFIVTILRRVNFHYSIKPQFLTLRQGILSKQQRHIPYGVIQNLFVKQDLFDRIFGLSSLAIENASQRAGALTAPQRQKVFGLRIGKRQQVETVGFSGNKISIPGLTKANAEILKGIVLQKMKENPIEDGQSGL